MRSDYSFVAELSKRVGKLLLRDFDKHKGLATMRGTAKEITTKFDKIADKVIVKALRKRFPGYGVLSEESAAVRKEREFVWIVDPIDGSSNFATGNPFFAVSIALLHNNEPIFGAIYAPALHDLFIAEEGKGAFLNGKEIQVSKIAELKHAYLLSCLGGEKSNERISKINAVVHPIIKDLRMLGSAALEGAWIASGRAEAYFTTNIFPWDIASAIVLTREAGGKITDFKGKEWKAKQSDVIFSNGLVHEKLLHLIKEANA